MRCYTCSKETKNSEAVAVCSVCGKGLCPQHAKEREIPMTQHVSGWADQSAVHILCGDCSQIKSLTD